MANKTALTSQEILQRIKNDSKKGVGYYNKDNIKNKENKENKNNYADDVSLGEPHLLHNPLSFVSLGIASCEAQEVNSEAILASPEAVNPGSEIAQNSIYDQMKTALIQLFDNGEDTLQRYKCKVRINLTDGTNPEFIASLTKDIRNFKKYIPVEGREEVIEFATEVRKKIKKITGNYPYIGKFHFNAQGAGNRTIEPMTAVAIWYDADAKGWSGCLMIYDWVHQFDLFSQYLTDKQRAARVKAQDTFTHPNHQKARPLTWAQRRAQGLK
jgi:hypothetical protein